MSSDWFRQQERTTCPDCGKPRVHHIVKEGARYHIISWYKKDGRSSHCSEPACEINHRGCGKSKAPIAAALKDTP